MRWKRFAMIGMIGLAAILWLGDVASADEVENDAPQPPLDWATQLDGPPPVDSPPGPGPRDPGFGGPRPRGHGFGQGRGPEGEGRPPQGPPPNGPGPGRAGMGRGMGPGGGGPRGLGHPGGPPRWPHDSWDALQKNDPEMYELLVKDSELDTQTRQLAMQYRRAPVAGREAIKKELEQLVGQHFEVRQQRRTLELKRLEEELERLRNAIEARNKARKELVGKRMTQLIGEQQGLGF